MCAAAGKAAKLKTFELPKAVHLEGKINELNQGFSIENDCLTPTFKLKRPQLLKRYQTEIDAMYITLGVRQASARTQAALRMGVSASLCVFSSVVCCFCSLVSFVLVCSSSACFWWFCKSYSYFSFKNST